MKKMSIIVGILTLAIVALVKFPVGWLSKESTSMSVTVVTPTTPVSESIKTSQIETVTFTIKPRLSGVE